MYILGQPNTFFAQLAADVLYTEEDLEDPGFAAPLLATLALLARLAGPAGTLELVLAYEETTARAVAPLQAFWRGLEERGWRRERVPYAALHPGYRRAATHVARIRPPKTA